MNNRVCAPTHPKINVWSTTTASDTWLSRYLVVDLNTRNTPGTHPYCNRQELTDQTKLRKFNTMKYFYVTLLYCENFLMHGNLAK